MVGSYVPWSKEILIRNPYNKESLYIIRNPYENYPSIGLMTIPLPGPTRPGKQWEFRQRTCESTKTSHEFAPFAGGGGVKPTTLWYTNIAMKNGPVPIEKMGIFYCYVILPEGQYKRKLMCN